LREAAINPARIEEYTGQIEHLSTEQLTQLEEATGVALATSQVDLAWVRGSDIRSQERRLMPEYVEKFFVRAAEREKIPLRLRADGLYAIERVPIRLRDQHLSTARRYGVPAQEYRKLTFDKTLQQRDEHLDAVLLSPGHPLFAALGEVLLGDLEGVQGHAALFVDPRVTESYQVHFFEVQIVSEEPLTEAKHSSTGEARTQVLYATLAAVIDGSQGKELAPADLLHDLTPLPEEATVFEQIVPPDPQTIVALERWVRVKVQFPLKQQQARERQRLLQIRREYITKMFAEQIKRLQHRYMELYRRVQKGDEAARLARDEADRRQKELRQRLREKEAELDRLQVVREGVVRYIGTALVVPMTQTSLATQLEQQSAITSSELVRNDEIERIGMDYVMNYEQKQGREPEDISRNHDGSGFDIRSTHPLTGEIRRIEVKARAAEGEFVELTPNEWLQAHRHGESYWLYVVWNCAQKPYLITIQDPARILAQVIQQQVVIEGYRVPGEAIARLNTHKQDGMQHEGN
jgi:hypothetical protein